MTVPARIWSVRKRILRVLPRRAVARLANVRFSFLYSRRRLDEIVIECWPEAGILDAFADVFEQAHYIDQNEEDAE